MSQRPSTVVLEENNQFGIENTDSDVEDKGDWHDEATKEPTLPTRHSAAKVVIEVCSSGWTINDQ